MTDWCEPCRDGDHFAHPPGKPCSLIQCACDFTTVGPIVELPFMVMTEQGFPDGLRCIHCKRSIRAGQPYISDVQGIYPNGDEAAVVTCVYCPANISTPPASTSAQEA